jgi:hypothetical protein
MVPVAVEQVGCAVTLAVGAEGIDGLVATVRFFTAEIHVGSVVLLTKILCDPEAKPVKVVESW